MSKNLKIIKLSELPDSRSVESTFFYGYDANPTVPLDKQSVKIPFSAVAKASNERRIALVMESDSQIIPIGEKMKITKVICKNVSELKIRQADQSETNDVNIPLDGSFREIDLSKYVTAQQDAIISIVKDSSKGTDPVTSTVYLFTKILE